LPHPRPTPEITPAKRHADIRVGRLQHGFAAKVALQADRLQRGHDPLDFASRLSGSSRPS
jgi:hypothetical protein